MMERLRLTLVKGGGKTHIVIDCTPRRTLCGISAGGMAETGRGDAHLLRGSILSRFKSENTCLTCLNILKDKGRATRTAFVRWLDRETGKRRE